MSASFNGSSSTIALPSGFFSYERTQAFSISAFVYCSGSKSGSFAGYTVYSNLQTSENYRGVEFFLLWTSDSISPANKLILANYISNNLSTNRITIVGSSDLPASTWTHVCMTYDGSSTAAGAKYYVNGARETETAVQNNLSATILNSETPRIGTRGSSTQPFKGEMQSVGFWNAELNADEVASLAKGFTPSKVRPQSLVAEIPFIREIQDTKGNALTASNMSVGSNSQRIYA